MVRIEQIIPRNMLTNPGLIARWSRKIEAQDFTAAISAVQDKKCRNKLLDLQIVPDAFLKKTYSLPKAARKTLDQVLALKIREFAPENAPAMRWHAEIIGQKTGKIEVAQLICRQSDIDNLIAAATTAGTTIRTVSIAGFPGSALYSAVRQTDRPIRLWWGAISAVLLAGFAFEYGKGEYLRYQLNTELARVGQETQSLASTMKELRDQEVASAVEYERMATLVHTVNRDRSRPELLENLTSALPDNAWVPEIRMNGSDVSMTVHASIGLQELMETLSAKAGLSEIILTAPVVKDHISGKSRYQVVAKMEPAG